MSDNLTHVLCCDQSVCYRESNVCERPMREAVNIDTRW